MGPTTVRQLTPLEMREAAVSPPPPVETTSVLKPVLFSVLGGVTIAISVAAATLFVRRYISYQRGLKEAEKEKMTEPPTFTDVHISPQVHLMLQ